MFKSQVLLVDSATVRMVPLLKNESLGVALAKRFGLVRDKRLNGEHIAKLLKDVDKELPIDLRPHFHAIAFDGALSRESRHAAALQWLKALPVKSGNPMLEVPSVLLEKLSRAFDTAGHIDVSLNAVMEHSEIKKLTPKILENIITRMDGLVFSAYGCTAEHAEEIQGLLGAAKNNTALSAAFEVIGKKNAMYVAAGSKAAADVARDANRAGRAIEEFTVGNTGVKVVAKTADQLKLDYRAEYTALSAEHRDASIKSVKLELALADSGYDVTAAEFGTIRRTNKIPETITADVRQHMEAFLANEKECDRLKVTRGRLAGEEKYFNLADIEVEKITSEVNRGHSGEVEAYRATLAPKFEAAKLKLNGTALHAAEVPTALEEPPKPLETAPHQPTALEEPPKPLETAPKPPEAATPKPAHTNGADPHANCTHDHSHDPKPKTANAAGEEAGKAKGVMKWIGEHRIGSAAIAAGVIGVGAFALSAMKGREASADQSRGA